MVKEAQQQEAEARNWAITSSIAKNEAEWTGGAGRGA